MLGHLGTILGPSWGLFEAFLGPSWAMLGPCWATSGPSLGHLGAISEPLAASLGPLGASGGHKVPRGGLGSLFPPHNPHAYARFRGSYKEKWGSRAGLPVYKQFPGLAPPFTEHSRPFPGWTPPFHKLKTPLRESWEARARLRARRGGGYSIYDIRHTTY